MRVLVVGSGAREHAIVWKLAQSPWDPQLFALPGNPGMGQYAACLPGAADDVARVLAAVAEHDVDLVVVGPEAPLARGLADACEAAGVAVFGPSQAAARLETSKGFCKQLLQNLGVRTADFGLFRDLEAARSYVRAQGTPIVIKADGLAAGKGVVIAEDEETAFSVLEDLMVHGRFGASGQQVVVESYLTGPELSLMCFVDAETVVPMIPARDYKRIGDGNTGPNTGGMGAIAPVPDVDAALVEEVRRTIVQPVVRALAAQGTPYRGVLYAGLMLTEEGPAVIEFNARFGDPETQVVLPLLDGDLLEVAWAVAHDQLGDVQVAWKAAAATAVVAAAPGYPDSPRTGAPLQLGTPVDGLVFHAGTALRDGALVTAGGRVLTAVGLAERPADARRIAYEIIDRVYFEGKQVRTDIGR
ncbi:MAG: phosphoribosylamine--glycine ligase [Alicyclobacillus sp.]|nr:phosphoribosylamine--glycine ligase [Alicyclobacillus sp.]